MKTKVVIFGCGYVGSKLAESCLEKGWEVTALTRNHATADSLTKRGIETIVADLMERDWHAKISLQQNYLVDCVGAAEPSLEGYNSSYYKGMQSILEWAEKADKPMDAMLFTSSTSVYPQTNGSLVSEKSGHEGVSSRAEILLDAEKLCQNVSSEKVLKSFVLRFAGLYGPKRHLLLQKVKEGKIINGSSQRILNLLHRDDAVSSIISCLESSKHQSGTILNVSDGYHASRGEIVDWIAERINVTNPGFDEKEKPGLPNRKIDNSKIKNCLGWTPKFPGFKLGYEDLLASL